MEKKQIQQIRYQSLFDYYNTNRETGFVLADSKEAAKNQQERVLVTFIRLRKPMAVFQVINYLFPGENVNDHRYNYARAITNLKREGYLIKKSKEFMVMGHSGKMVHVYKLNEKIFEQPKGQMELF